MELARKPARNRNEKKETNYLNKKEKPQLLDLKAVVFRTFYRH
jgi:hypothetical protein